MLFSLPLALALPSSQLVLVPPFLFQLVWVLALVVQPFSEVQQALSSPQLVWVSVAQLLAAISLASQLAFLLPILTLLQPEVLIA